MLIDSFGGCDKAEGDTTIGAIDDKPDTAEQQAKDRWQGQQQ
jgi:hypothetical protein